MIPSDNPLIVKDLRFRDPAWDREIIESIVRDLIAETMPGTEGKSREELEEVVTRVHLETVERVLARELGAIDAPAYEWRRVIEELKKSRGWSGRGG